MNGTTFALIFVALLIGLVLLTTGTAIIFLSIVIFALTGVFWFQDIFLRLLAFSTIGFIMTFGSWYILSGK